MVDDIVETDGLESAQTSEPQVAQAQYDRGLGIRFWRQDTLALILAVVLLFCGVGLLLLIAVPLLALVQSLVGMNLPGVDAAVRWLSSGNRGLILAVALALLGLLSFVALRFRLRHNALLYIDAGCPQCREHELIRVRRRKWDRVIAYLGIPVRRYVCRNCSWDGLRISGPLPNADSDPEAIPADII